MEPTVMTAIISAVAAVIGAALGYAASKRKADIEENSIESQNQVLIYKVDELIRDVKALGQRFDDYSSRLTTLEADVQALEKRVEKLER